MGNLLGEPFRKYVRNQIIERQKIHAKTVGRSMNDIKYLNSRNAWVKLASGVSLDQKRFDLLKGNPMIEGVKLGQDLAVKNVLFNGLASFGSSTLEDPDNITSKDTFNYNLQQRSGITGTNKAYGVGGKDFGYSPMPGIIDVDVKDLNRGSIKKATINIKCHNRNQLDIIDILYMRLGYTVFLEWGYDKYIDGEGNFQNMETTLIDTDFFQEKFKNSDYSKYLPLIEEKRESTSGNYDGMFGTISNFSWTFESDGSYSVKIEMITLGDIIESLKINLPSSKVGSEYRETDLQALKKKGKIEKSDFFNTVYPNLKNALQEYYNFFKEGNNITEFNKIFQPGISPSTSGGIGAGSSSATKETDLRFTMPNKSFSQYTNNILEDNKTKVAEVIKGNYFQKLIEEFFNNRNFSKKYKNQHLLRKEIPIVVPNEPPFRPTEKTVISYKLKNGIEASTLPKDQNFIKLTDLNNLLLPFETRFGLNKKLDPIEGGQTGLLNLNPRSKVDSTSIDGSFRELKPLNNDQRDVIFTLFTFDQFTDLVFEDFLAENKKNTSLELLPIVDNNVQEVPEVDKVEQEITAFESAGIEKRNKNKVYEYFWSIRTLIKATQKITAGKKIEGSGIFGTNFLRENAPDLNEVDYGLDSLPKIKTNIDSIGVNKGKEIGYILNPTPELPNIKWSTEVGFPKYESSQIPLQRPTPSSPTPKSEFNNPLSSLPGKPPENITTNFPKDVIKLNIFPIEKSYFIRLGTFLEFLKEKIIPKIEKTNIPLINIDTTTETNICYVIDNVISLDIRKCIINNNNFQTSDSSSPLSVKIYDGIENFIPEDLNSENIQYGQIMNIYFNFSRIEEIMDDVDVNNKVSLFNVLKNICSDINESLGNINNIEPIINKDTNTVKLIDQTQIPELPQIAKLLSTKFPQYSDFSDSYSTDDKIYPTLELFGYSSNGRFPEGQSNFVHSIGLTTEISKEYATMITIGATANGSVPGVESTAFSSWNTGIFDRFKNNLTDASNNGSLEEQNSNVIKNYATFVEKARMKEGHNTVLGLELDSGDEEVKTIQLNIDDTIISTNKDVVSNYYIYAQAKTTQENLKNTENPNNLVESSTGFLPFNLKIDMDGISGMKIYNKLKVNSDFLPSNYGPTLDFLITGVNHKLSNNNWDTSLTTLATNKSIIGK